MSACIGFFFFFSSRRRHTRFDCDWSSDVCSSDLLVRRVARVLQISKCSMVLAKAGDQLGVVVAAYENPMLRNLQIELVRYPEIQRALATGRTVLVEDVQIGRASCRERV